MQLLRKGRYEALPSHPKLDLLPCRQHRQAYVFPLPLRSFFFPLFTSRSLPLCLRLTSLPPIVALFPCSVSSETQFGLSSPLRRRRTSPRPPASSSPSSTPLPSVTARSSVRVDSPTSPSSSRPDLSLLSPRRRFVVFFHSPFPLLRLPCGVSPCRHRWLPAWVKQELTFFSLGRFAFRLCNRSSRPAVSSLSSLKRASREDGRDGCDYAHDSYDRLDEPNKNVCSKYRLVLERANAERESP
jgi:hypothetical protein